MLTEGFEPPLAVPITANRLEGDLDYVSNGLSLLLPLVAFGYHGLHVRPQQSGLSFAEKMSGLL